MATTHDFGNKGVTFTVTDKHGNSKVEAFDYAETIADPVERLKALRKGREADRNAYRGAIGFILEALQTSDCLAYSGAGLLEVCEDDGDGNIKVVGHVRKVIKTDVDRKGYNGWKGAFRRALEHIMLPTLRAAHPKDQTKADDELSEMLKGGTFAVAASAARKFFYFTGTLPCAYDNNGNADISRALSIPAMQKILNEIPEEDAPDDGYGAKVAAMHKAWLADGTNADPNDLAALFARLDSFALAVKDAYDRSIIATTAAMMALNDTNPADSAPALAQIKTKEPATV